MWSSFGGLLLMVLFHQIFSQQFYKICNQSFEVQSSPRPSQDSRTETWVGVICGDDFMVPSSELFDLSLPRDNLPRRQEQIMDVLTGVSSRCKN